MNRTDSRIDRPGRPLSVTLVVFGVLLFAGVQWLGFWQACKLVIAPPHIIFPVSPVYLLLRALFWGCISLLLAWGLWFGRRWAFYLALVGFPLFLIVFWLERFIIVNSIQRFSNGAFVTTILLVVIILLYLILFRPTSREFFGEKYDGRTKN
jgi:hypothetical protein